MKNIKDKLYLKLYDLAKNLKVEYFYQLYLNSMSWSQDRIEAYQIAKIKSLLIKSYAQNKYYCKQINASGFDIENFRYLDQLKEFPILSRKDLQENLKDLCSDGFDTNLCFKGSSSGSTGVPVIYYQDIQGISANIAAINFCKYLSGYRFGSKWLNIWGNPQTVNVDWKKSASKLKSLLFNELRFPAYRLHELHQYQYLQKNIERQKPKYIYGYTNAIFLFSQYLEKKGIKYDFVKGVFTTAENLLDSQRSLIEDNLGKVYDHYGCSEIKGVAVETTFSDGYSIIEPHVYLEPGEKVDDSGARKILLTDLNNSVMPFIRYQNDDIAEFDENAKVSTLQYKKLKSICGRISDIITLPNGGNLVVPSFFGSTKLKEIEEIKQYQIINYGDYLKINLHVNQKVNANKQKLIRDFLNVYIPNCIKYKLVFNEEIIMSNNGKFKLVVDKKP